MINKIEIAPVDTSFLEKEIAVLNFYDMVFYNGPFHIGTPIYSEEEKIAMQEKIEELQKQLDEIKSGVNTK